MNDLQRTILKSLSEMSKDDIWFIHNVQITLPVKSLCSALNIDRNRYNYLVRSKQLDNEILKLRKEVDLNER